MFSATEDKFNDFKFSLKCYSHKLLKYYLIFKEKLIHRKNSCSHQSWKKNEGCQGMQPLINEVKHNSVTYSP